MGLPAGEQTRASLLASRREATRLVSVAERKADELAALAGAADDALTAVRLERLHDLRGQIHGQQRRIETAFAAMAEAMAGSCMRLAEAARDADFSAPPWPAGISRTVEIRLAETREITFRFETRGAGDQSPRRRV